MPEFDATTSKQVQQYLDSHGGVAVIDCHAVWCGPCKAIAPYVHERSQQTGILLIKVDVDQADELAKAYKVQAMPTFLTVHKTWDNVIETAVGGGKPNVDKVFMKAQSNK